MGQSVVAVNMRFHALPAAEVQRLSWRTVTPVTQRIIITPLVTAL